MLHVRYWPKTDMSLCTAHIRFWGQSGHGHFAWRMSAFAVAIGGKADMPFRAAHHMSAFDPKRTSNAKILAGNHKTEPVPSF
jgi:hypothetical protein